MKLKIKNSQLAKAAGLDKLKEKLAKSKKSKEEIIEANEIKIKETVSISEPLGGLTGQQTDKPRRIRAKSHSSFVPVSETEQPLATNAFDEATYSPTQEDGSMSISTAIASEDSIAVDILDTESYVETTKEVQLETHNHDYLDNEKSCVTTVEKQETKETTPPPVVRLNTTFGPTGRHVKQLLTPSSFNRDNKKPRTNEAGTENKSPFINDRNRNAGSKTRSEESNNKTTTKTDSVTKPSTFSPIKRDGVKKGRNDFHDFRNAQKKSGDNVKSFTGRDRLGLNENSDDDRWRKKRPVKVKKTQEEIAIQRPSHIKIMLPITVKDLAVEMKLKASEIVQRMFIHGLIYVINDLIGDETTVQFIGSEFGCQVSIDNTEKDRIRIVSNTVKEEIIQTNSEDLRARPPVIAFMGHVDHGKTTLVDALRKTNIASQEVGAITQHIGAFRCSTNHGIISILDTPGHEAFFAMRARGAEVCDIVVLVVAGDEGIKEQTIEAITHAKNSNLSVVVAVNKSDKPGYDLEKVYRQLADNNLLPEAWGGTICTVSISAKLGKGLDELLETLALQAEVLELKANPNVRARGIVIESELHKGFGYIATVLIQNGTLRLGDALVLNDVSGRIKTMHDENGKAVKEAAPSTPVLITGLSGMPKAGDSFVVVKNEREARDIVEARIAGQQRYAMQQQRKTFETMLQNKKNLRLIVKADVQGSVEALLNSLNKIKSDKVSIEIVSAGIGEISESDIRLASASKAIIIGLHTAIESHAESLSKNCGVKIFLHTIIYHAIDEVTNLMQSILDPIAEEKELGIAEIKAVFKSSQVGAICGCLVIDGLITRNAKSKLIRNNEIIWRGGISSLRKVKEDVKEVRKGLECGILLDDKGSSLAEIGDLIQCYEIVYHPQKL